MQCEDMSEEVPASTPEVEKVSSDRLPTKIQKEFWNLEKVVSLSAFVVSLVTVLALIYQIRISREQNNLARQQQELVRIQQYASVLPYLEIQVGTNNGDHLFEINLLNNGVGPAFVEEVRTVYNGKIYPGDPFMFYKTAIMPQIRDTISLGVQSITIGQIIPAGKSVPVLIAHADFTSPEDRDVLFGFFGHPTEEEPELAQIEVAYSSIYGEKWVIKGYPATPTPLPVKEKTR